MRLIFQNSHSYNTNNRSRVSAEIPAIQTFLQSRRFYCMNIRSRFCRNDLRDHCGLPSHSLRMIPMKRTNKTDRARVQASEAQQLSTDKRSLKRRQHEVQEVRSCCRRIMTTTRVSRDRQIHHRVKSLCQ
jgi:hypothetical protein